MTLVTRARAAGILAVSLLMLGAPGALALIPNYLPDAQIRPGWNPIYTDGGVFNTDAWGQSVSYTGEIGQKLTFFIKISNLGASTDTFKVRRSAGYNNGYRVRYYDAANNDVTGQVTTGTFTTPLVAHHGEYVMRATVKVRSIATACSSTSRLITVSSFNFPSAKDAVRFTALRAPGCANLTLSPGELSSVNDYSFSFGPAEDGETQTFTVKNDGKGVSEVLAFMIGGDDFIIGSSSTCRGILPAGGTCTFQFVVTGCPSDTGLNGYFALAGDAIQYLTLHLKAMCSLSG